MSKRRIVFDALNDLNIPYEIAEHPAVLTIEDIDALGLDPNGEVAKNLFLCDDKKQRFFLVTVRKTKTVNLQNLREVLGSRRLSFVSEERLGRMMGLDKGEVTPFGILNDTTGIIEVFLDKDFKNFKRIGVHPNDNTATVWLEPADLERVIKKSGADFSYIAL